MQFEKMIVACLSGVECNGTWQCCSEFLARQSVRSKTAKAFSQFRAKATAKCAPALPFLPLFNSRDAAGKNFEVHFLSHW